MDELVPTLTGLYGSATTSTTTTSAPATSQD